jgi:hypothetical protein
MDLKNTLNNSGKIIKKAIIIDIIIIVLSIILWLLFRMNAVSSLVDIVFVLGSITTGCGAYFIIGAKIGSVDYNYFQSRFASQINYYDRSRQEIQYMEDSYYNATIFFIAGLVAIGMSIIAYKILG